MWNRFNLSRVQIAYCGKFIWLASVPTTHWYFSGTVTQFCETSTMLLAFKIPNPNALLTQKPAPFFLQPALFFREEYSAVHVIRCCMSRHVRFGLKRQTTNFLFVLLESCLFSLTFNAHNRWELILLNWRDIPINNHLSSGASNV